MAFDFAAAKARVQRVVHDTFAVECEYKSTGPLAVPVLLRVRWHNQLAATGDLNGEGYPISIDTIDKVIFDVAELTGKNVKISRGGRLKFTTGLLLGQVLVVDTLDPKTDNGREIWHVGKLNGKQLN
jgi:hypothetical protein